MHAESCRRAWPQRPGRCHARLPFHVALGLSSLGCLCFCASSLAALDPQSSSPYKLTVVLKVAENRLLTPVFKEQLQRELHDSLQDTFGPLALVKVVEQHPILEEVGKRGLAAAIENYQGTEPAKIHVVLVDLVDGSYEIQAAQYDPLTALATPLVRKSRLEEPAGRAAVARTAAGMIDADFGLVGTVVEANNLRQVQVAIKGGKLGAPLERWLKTDAVFALVQENRLGGSRRVPEALLQVVERSGDGGCVCRLFARYADAASRLENSAGVLGYRCIKLGTARAPLRLRLVNDRGLPWPNLQLVVGRSGFESVVDKPQFQGSTDREGFLQTSERFEHAAFVRVIANGAPVAQIPVPMFADHVAVYTVNVDPRATRLGELLALRERYLRRLDDCLQLQAELARTLGERLGQADHKGALDAARKGRERLERDLKELEAEQNALAAEVARAQLDREASGSLRADAGRRQQLDQARTDLADFIGQWEKRLQQQAELKERAALIDRARLARREARYDEAIQLYKEALKKGTRAPALEAELKALEQAWTLKNQEGHREARRFIYTVWPELDTPEKILARLDEARRHFAECKKAGDKLSLRKLLLANNEHYKWLEKLQASLRKDREDDRARLETIRQVAERLKKLHEEANAFIAGK